MNRINFNTETTKVKKLDQKLTAAGEDSFKQPPVSIISAIDDPDNVSRVSRGIFIFNSQSLIN